MLIAWSQVMGSGDLPLAWGGPHLCGLRPVGGDCFCPLEELEE